MPVRNGSNYLREALNKIKLQNVNMEIIVVDEDSSDDTCKIAKDFGCVILQHKIPKGLVASKNSALKIARGKYILFHDHDDVMNDNALLQMLKELKEDEEISAVMAQLQDFYSPELSEEERNRVIIRDKPYFGLFSGAILMKRDVFDVIGLFDESLKAGDIVDWSNKMRENNLQIKKINFVSANRRIHNSNFGRTNRERQYKDYAAILRSNIKKELCQI